MKTSIVKSVQGNGTWEGQYGLMYKFEVCFENGDCGQYMSKSENQNKFVTGRETNYEYIGGKYPKVKPVSDFQKSGNAPKQDVQEYIIKQSSLKCATDYVIANGGDATQVLEYADMFTKWVLKGEKPNPQPQNMPF